MSVPVDTVSRIARANRNIFVVLPGKKGVQGSIGLLDSRDE